MVKGKRKNIKKYGIFIENSFSALIGASSDSTI